jgi:hypothetical protein
MMTSESMAEVAVLLSQLQLALLPPRTEYAVAQPSLNEVILVKHMPIGIGNSISEPQGLDEAQVVSLEYTQ